MTDAINVAVRKIIDTAIDELVALGAERPAALKILAFSQHFALPIDGNDAELLDLRITLLDEIDSVLTPDDDQRLQ